MLAKFHLRLRAPSYSTTSTCLHCHHKILFFKYTVYVEFFFFFLKNSIIMKTEGGERGGRRRDMFTGPFIHVGERKQRRERKPVRKCYDTTVNRVFTLETFIFSSFVHKWNLAPWRHSRAAPRRAARPSVQQRERKAQLTTKTVKLRHVTTPSLV